MHNKTTKMLNNNNYCDILFLTVVEEAFFLHSRFVANFYSNTHWSERKTQRTR